MTTHSATVMIVRPGGDKGEHLVVTEADEVLWIADELMDKILAQSDDPDLAEVGAAMIFGDLLAFGTPGEGLGRLTYRLAGREGDWHVAGREQS